MTPRAAFMARRPSESSGAGSLLYHAERSFTTLAASVDATFSSLPGLLIFSSSDASTPSEPSPLRSSGVKSVESPARTCEWGRCGKWCHALRRRNTLRGGALV